MCVCVCVCVCVCGILSQLPLMLDSGWNFKTRGEMERNRGMSDVRACVYECACECLYVCVRGKEKENERIKGVIFS